MEFTKDAILVAKAFMELPRNERDKFKRQIETKALEYTSAVPDEHLKRREALAPAATKATKRRKRGTATR